LIWFFAQRKLLASEIIDKHFRDSCSEPVNVDGPVRDAVLQNKDSGATDLFDAAHKQVRTLLIKLSAYLLFS
jgi:hypothetical protein